jgi:rRNA processing protein Gar1
MAMEAPWWIYLIVLGIVISGYMFVRTTKKERELEQFYIEQEGKIYLEKIEQERKKRQLQEN